MNAIQRLLTGSLLLLACVSSPAQARHNQTQQLLLAHKACASELGRQLMLAEQMLDQVFARRPVTPRQVHELTADIARLQGQIRAEHLLTHLSQSALLSHEQINQYSIMHGYKP